MAQSTGSGSPLAAAVIGVEKLESSLAFYRDVIGLDASDTVRWAGPEFEKLWHLPAGASARASLCQAVLADGLFDATSALVIQSLREPAGRNQADMVRHRKRILDALPVMDRDAAGFGLEDFHIGHVCFAGGLNFFDLRKPLARVELDPADAAFDWRADYPTLAAWYGRVCERPSLQVRPSHLGMTPQGAPKGPPSTERKNHERDDSCLTGAKRDRQTGGGSGRDAV